MKPFLKKLDWIFDFYIAYYLYNSNKVDSYYKYMYEKWNVHLDNPCENEIRNITKKEYKF